MAGCIFDVSIKEHVVTVQCNIDEMDKLLEQTAASVISSLQGLPTKKAKPISGPGLILAQRMDWAPHGFINALQSQVGFLYSVVNQVVESGDNPRPAMFCFPATAKIVVAALKEYQKWKDKLCEDEVFKYGPEAADDGFFKKNWTDKSEEFLQILGLCL